MRLIDADRLCEGLLNRWSIADTRKEELIRQVMADIVTPIVVSQPTINEPQKWIPCSERLPVICEYDVNGQKTFSCRVLSTQAYGNGLVFVGSDRYTSDRGWLSEVLDENGAPESKVIAWMPLPDPWKEAKE